MKARTSKQINSKETNEDHGNQDDLVERVTTGEKHKRLQYFLKMENESK